jgi:hypothetical protein
MVQKQIMKKLEKAVEKRKIEITKSIASMKRGKQDDWTKNRIQYMELEKSRLKPRTIASFDYRIRDNYFTNSSGTCEFFPDRLYAHSYTWYDLFKVIKGNAILNTYNYSRQTTDHIWKMKSLLKTLGIKFQTLNAPRGLQDLDRALAYELDLLAKQHVLDKYGRNTKKPSLEKFLKQENPELRLLAKLGFKATKTMRLKALQEAEQSRASKLRRDKEKRARIKALAQIEVIQDFDNTMHDEQGIHAVIESQWQWQDKQLTSLNNWQINNAKSDALEKGFKKVFVHSKQKPRLTLVASS